MPAPRGTQQCWRGPKPLNIRTDDRPRLPRLQVPARLTLCRNRLARVHCCVGGRDLQCEITGGEPDDLPNPFNGHRLYRMGALYRRALYSRLITKPTMPCSNCKQKKSQAGYLGTWDGEIRAHGRWQTSIPGRSQRRKRPIGGHCFTLKKSKTTRPQLPSRFEIFYRGRHHALGPAQSQQN